MATIQGIYIALFGRPADPLGLDYFNGVTDGGADLSQIGDLSGQPEYLSRFEGQNNAQIVTAIYQDLFGRNPDAAGLAFFTAQLNSGAQNINTIAINILDGARGEDAALVAAKIAAADQFTAAVRADPDALAAYQGQDGIEFGQAFLNQIDSSDDTFTNAEVTSQVATFGQTGGGGEGDVFTLAGPSFVDAVGADDLTGTTGNDTFRAVSPNSLNSADLVDGGAGFDTLNISAGAFGGTVTPGLTSIERINNSAAGTILDLSSSTGVQQAWSVGAGLFTYAGVSTATVIGASGAGGTQVDVDYVGTLDGATTANFAVDKSGGNVDFFSNVDGAAIENVVVNVAANTAATDVEFTGTFSALETLTVTGAGSAVIEVSDVSELTSFNSTASTGNITFLSANDGDNQLTSLTFGSGNDTTYYDTDYNNAGNGGDAVTINLGAGNDTITVALYDSGSNNDATAVSLTLGAGNDLVLIDEEFSNIYEATADGITEGLFTITDFNVGQDTLDVSALAGSAYVVTNAEQGAITAASSLLAAVTLAATYGPAAVGEVLAFNYGGDAYVFSDSDGSNTFNADDGLIKLTGVSAGDLNATNFVVA